MTLMVLLKGRIFHYCLTGLWDSVQIFFSAIPLSTHPSAHSTPCCAHSTTVKIFLYCFFHCIASTWFFHILLYFFADIFYFSICIKRLCNRLLKFFSGRCFKDHVRWFCCLINPSFEISVLFLLIQVGCLGSWCHRLFSVISCIFCLSVGCGSCLNLLVGSLSSKFNIPVSSYFCPPQFPFVEMSISSVLLVLLAHLVLKGLCYS